MKTVDEILKNKKYNTICKETVKRIYQDLKEKKPYLSKKQLIKDVKKKLYKININYFKNFNYSKALNELKKDSGINTHKDLLKHYDINRLLSLNGLYSRIFEITGKPKVLLDIACGLNPLTLPWMNLAENADYYCYDIEKNLINFLNNYFKLIGKPYKAFLQDAISNTPSRKADVALIFKASTCFEWQKEGNLIQVLKGLNCDWVVISLMMRGKYNLRGCRNYFKNLLEKEFVKNDSYEIVTKKEYFHILKL